MTYYIDPHGPDDYFYECEHCGEHPSQSPPYNDMKVTCEHCGKDYYARLTRVRYAIQSTWDAPNSTSLGWPNAPRGWLCKKRYCNCGDDAEQKFCNGFVDKCERCGGLWYKHRLVWVWSGGGGDPCYAYRFKRLGDAKKALKTGEVKRAMRAQNVGAHQPEWPQRSVYYGYTVRIFFLKERGHRLDRCLVWKVVRKTQVWPELPVLDRMAAV